MALREGSSEAGREYPEAEYLTQAAQPTLPMAVGMSAGLLLIGAIVIWILRKKTIR